LVQSNKRQCTQENQYFTLIYDLVVALAANKSDLYEYEDIVPEQLGKNFAKEINALFIETSAKSATGIDVILYY